MAETAPNTPCIRCARAFGAHGLISSVCPDELGFFQAAAAHLVEPAAAPGGRESLQFAAVSRAIKQGSRNVAFAASRTMARRIANALNSYKPNSRGY